MIDMDVIHIFAIKDNRIVDLNRKVEEMQKNIAGLKAALDRITGTLTRDRMIDIAHDAIAEFGGDNQ